MTKYFLFILGISMMWSCIGNDYIDDRVEPEMRITNAIDSLAIDSTYQFQVLYLNNVGSEETVNVIWSSSNSDVISISQDGFARAISAGSSDIEAFYHNGEKDVRDSKTVGVGERTIVSEENGKRGTVNTTSSYKLHGDFTIKEDDSGGIILAFGEDYEASTALPGLYIYLTNNPNTVTEALEIQAVEVFSGAHTYNIPDVGINDFGYVLYFCKPFNVKVGHGEIVE